MTATLDRIAAAASRWLDRQDAPGGRADSAQRFRHGKRKRGRP